MAQPQPYIYDGIFYSLNKINRSVSPISNYSQKKHKSNNIINQKTKRLLDNNIIYSNITIKSKKCKLTYNI